uniref:BTSP n=1 Tax=Argas monolakensis TaxID=34602 RepID=Q09JS8_ARGMO|nr:BTSP [Argas monolakensis]
MDIACFLVLVFTAVSRADTDRVKKCPDKAYDGPGIPDNCMYFCDKDNDTGLWMYGHYVDFTKCQYTSDHVGMCHQGQCFYFIPANQSEGGNTSESGKELDKGTASTKQDSTNQQEQAGSSTTSGGSTDEESEDDGGGGDEDEEASDK